MIMTFLVEKREQIDSSPVSHYVYVHSPDVLLQFLKIGLPPRRSGFEIDFIRVAGFRSYIDTVRDSATLWQTNTKQINVKITLVIIL